MKSRMKKSVPVNAEECLGCESCVEVCEEDAITVEEDLIISKPDEY